MLKSDKMRCELLQVTKKTHTFASLFRNRGVAQLVRVRVWGA